MSLTHPVLGCVTFLAETSHTNTFLTIDVEYHRGQQACTCRQYSYHYEVAHLHDPTNTP